MAFVPNGLSCVWQALAGKYAFWVYRSADAFADVDATDYFAGCYERGLREGHMMIVEETDTDPPTQTLAYVQAIDADGNATVAAMAYAGDFVVTDLTFGTGGTIIGDTGTGTASSNAVTIDKMAGVLTTESLSTAAAGSQAITLTNSVIETGDIVLAHFVSVPANGTPVLAAVAGAGSATITIYNKHASAAFNGAFVIAFLVIKAP